MKPFVIYAHAMQDNVWLHVTFTRCYGVTIEDAVINFCLYMRDKFPTLNTYNFCIQQMLPLSDFSGYDSLDGILSVYVQDAATQLVHTAWDHEGA